MQSGLSMFEFLQRYSTEQECEAAVEVARWPSALVCPPRLGKHTPFVLTVQTTDNGRPPKVCTAQLPFRRSAIAEFCNVYLLRPLTVVSDGLACFTAAAHSGVHQRIVTVSGKASVRLPSSPRSTSFWATGHSSFKRASPRG